MSTDAPLIQKASSPPTRVLPLDHPEVTRRTHRIQEIHRMHNRDSVERAIAVGEELDALWNRLIPRDREVWLREHLNMGEDAADNARAMAWFNRRVPRFVDTFKTVGYRKMVMIARAHRKNPEVARSFQRHRLLAVPGASERRTLAQVNEWELSEVLKKFLPKRRVFPVQLALGYAHRAGRLGERSEQIRSVVSRLDAKTRQEVRRRIESVVERLQKLLSEL